MAHALVLELKAEVSDLSASTALKGRDLEASLAALREELKAVCAAGVAESSSAVELLLANAGAQQQQGWAEELAELAGRCALHRTAPHRTAPHRTAPHCTALHHLAPISHAARQSSPVQCSSAVQCSAVRLGTFEHPSLTVIPSLSDPMFGTHTTPHGGSAARITSSCECVACSPP